MTTAAPLVLFLLAADGGTPALCGTTPCEAFATPRAAFDRVMETPTLLLAVGEYHEIEGGPKVKSAIKRFTTDLLPTLKGKATSLIVETWMTNGRCGKVEAQAVKEVKKVTQRPDTTEDEVQTLLDRSFEMGVKNHILVLDCAEYASMLNEKGGLDAEKSLLLVRRKVEERAIDARDDGEGAVPGKLLLLYGGAIHNDVKPMEGWEAYSYGPSLTRKLDGGYVELDLVVPEYGVGDEDLVKEPWWPSAVKLAGTTKTVLVAPRPNVFILVFPAGVKAKAGKK